MITNRALCDHFNVAIYPVEGLNPTPSAEEAGKFFVSTLASDGFKNTSEIPLASSPREAEEFAVKYLGLQALYAKQQQRVQDKPLAAHGLTSYRYKGLYDWVMIGAHDDDDALNEANRSLATPTATIENLQVFKGGEYVDVFVPPDRTH